MNTKGQFTAFVNLRTISGSCVGLCGYVLLMFLDQDIQFLCNYTVFTTKLCIAIMRGIIYKASF